jgi:hypothetical protein
MSYQYSSRVESLKAQALQACSFLFATTSNFGLGGPHLASLVFTVVHDPPSRGRHVDRRLPSPPFWL